MLSLQVVFVRGLLQDLSILRNVFNLNCRLLYFAQLNLLDFGAFSHEFAVILGLKYFDHLDAIYT